jgi:hypothetical protein
LSHPAVQLPIQHSDEDYVGFLSRVLSSYTALLFKLTEPDDIIQGVLARRAEIEGFCSEALKAVQATFEGHPQDAYGHFVNAITPLQTVVEEQAVIGSSRHDIGLLYRVRRDSRDQLTREDLFHIPFEKRHCVATQRYSIPGLPCLYLSGSLYTCWAEMGRPPFHELHASAFWMDRSQTISVVDFSHRPKRLIRHCFHDGLVTNIPESRSMLLRHLILWPLMALCSIVVKHRDKPYKPEYIIPQMVLEWIRQGSLFDGVCYFSMHVQSVTEDRRIPTSNFVFPARNIIPKGRCSHLRSLWRLTKPYNWQLLNSVNIAPGVSSYGDFEFEFIEGHPETYAATVFGDVETKLERLSKPEMRSSNPNEGQVEP